MNLLETKLKQLGWENFNFSTQVLNLLSEKDKNISFNKDQFGIASQVSLVIKVVNTGNSLKDNISVLLNRAIDLSNRPIAIFNYRLIQTIDNIQYYQLDCKTEVVITGNSKITGDILENYNANDLTTEVVSGQIVLNKFYKI